MQWCDSSSFVPLASGLISTLLQIKIREIEFCFIVIMLEFRNQPNQA